MIQREFSVARQRINHFLLFKHIQRIEGSISPSSAFMWYPGSDCIWGKGCARLWLSPFHCQCMYKGTASSTSKFLGSVVTLELRLCLFPPAWLSEIEVVSSLCADDDFFFLPVFALIVF